MAHLKSLAERDARSVTTLFTKKIEDTLGFVAQNREVAAVVGDPGLGKTFGVHLFAKRHHVSQITLTAGPKPTPIALTKALLKDLRPGPVHGTLYDLSDEAITLLSESHRIVVVDEAQNLNSDGLNQLRFLHDAPNADWGLLLVGGHRCEASLCREPQLESRVARWVRLEPLTGDQLLVALRAYHPLFQFAEDKLLHAIDAQWAKGNWRRWARFLQAALDIADKTDHHLLDKTHAKATMDVLGPRRKRQP